MLIHGEVDEAVCLYRVLMYLCYIDSYREVGLGTINLFCAFFYTRSLQDSQGPLGFHFYFFGVFPLFLAP